MLIAVPTIPLCLHGKTDRAALVLTDGSDPACFTPRDGAERALAVWSAGARGRERTGVRRDVLQSGGRSLPATRLTAQVRRGPGVTLPPRVLIDVPERAAEPVGVLLGVAGPGQADPAGGA